MPFTKEGREERKTRKEWKGDDFSLTFRVWVPKAPRGTDAHPVGNYVSFVWNSGEESELETELKCIYSWERLTWKMCTVTRRPRLESGHHHHYVHFTFSICCKVYLTIWYKKQVGGGLVAKFCQTPWTIAYQVPLSILYYSIQWLNLLEFSYL